MSGGERTKAEDRRMRRLTEFYLSRDASGRNLFEIWESGDARGDSITPATCDEGYRRWMRRRLGELLAGPEEGLLSVGAGNAAIEVDVLAAGHRVMAVDVIAEAVDLARSKGLEAEVGDVREWRPAEQWSVVYADGLLGHVYDPAQGLAPVLGHVRSWLRPGGALVLSNDRPPTDDPSVPAGGVPGFHWLSTHCIRDAAEEAGFVGIECTEFVYERPVSGPRTRAIVVARAA
ncbi:class I SAM-dependent methyltransferase [Pseudonocardia endophytica]|uniref:class I SAM-dependent methyltransferase n=1 Tax=Pseudonocardia endophytica TaxID=401976 RepID=UPI001FB41B89|nr:methyltransferase domain-containing protein [Pseudonocardia endophytica]